MMIVQRVVKMYWVNLNIKQGRIFSMKFVLTLLTVLRPCPCTCKKTWL